MLTKERLKCTAYATVAILVSFLLYNFYIAYRLRPFPTVWNIKSMQAVLEDRTEPVRFEVPPEHWRSVLNATTPATVDPNPARWVIMGRLMITRRVGGKRSFILFWTGRSPGAFKEKDVYYRGGDSQQLENALHAAYAESNRGP